MSIINRIARLFKADVHSILDSMEDPHAVLTQALRDMQENISADERAIAEIVTQRENIGRKEADISEAILATKKQIELCLKNDNDNLSRPVIRKKLELERFHQSLAAQAEALARHFTEKGKALSNKQEKYREMKEKAALFAPATSACDDNALVSNTNSSTVAESDVEVALLAERERLFGQKTTVSCS